MKLFARCRRPALRPRVLPLAIAALWAGVAVADNGPAPAAEPVADTMHRLAADVQVLLPLLYQYRTPATPIDRALLEQQIGNMRLHLDRVAGSVAPKADTYQISYQALATQLQQAQRELARGNQQFGLSLLRSATSVCATCHTQDDRPTSWLMPPTAAMSDAFVAGEFLFMTRQYDAAFAAYSNWLRQQQPLSYDNRTQSAFERLLLIALQTKKSAGSISGLLTEFAQRGDISGVLKRKLTDWISGVDELQKRVDIGAHPDPAALQSMAAQWLDAGKNEPDGRIYLPETQRPQIVWLRGELYRALINETRRDMIADWLYWLAVSDRVLEYRFYYSLADLYVKQCMLEYSDDPIAQSCYREYENYIVFSYSGSGGTEIPADVEAELKALKARVFGTSPRRGR